MFSVDQTGLSGETWGNPQDVLKVKHTIFMINQTSCLDGGADIKIILRSHGRILWPSNFTLA